MVNSFTTREKHCLSKVDCRKHKNPVGGGNFVSAWSRIGASHSNFFHLRLRIDVLFPERAFVPDDFHGFDGARRRRALCFAHQCRLRHAVGPRAATTTARSASATRSSTALLQQNAPDFRSPSCGIGPFSSAAFVFRPFQSRAGAKRWGGSRFQQNGNRSNMSSMSGDLGRLTCSDLLWL